jgi:hypothetical protein
MDSIFYWTGCVFWIAVAEVLFVTAALAIYEPIRALVRAVSWVAFSCVKAKRHRIKIHWGEIPGELFHRWVVLMDQNIEYIRYEDGIWYSTFRWEIYPKDPQ